MRVNKNDLVIILSGSSRNKKDSREKRYRVLTVDKKSGKVTVEGVNVVEKHVRPSRRNPRGGKLSMEMPIDASNVQVVCPKCNKPTRVGARFAEDGAKFRVCKKCGTDISPIAPAKK
ncbi:MAG: 50S ribosomal protein L24 [Planctomycetaceae bacterium]|jgi:large subunit ribosomal protein L24|nr:50S ribosomal protein L24 [Planctomycetaceae bacterium]